MSHSIAIVGSGPAGCYLAQSLRKQFPEAGLSIFDRLPVPYGLVRYGVAPDHQGTKAVTEQFDRLFVREGVKFLGNVNVGVDCTLEELQRSFDVVVLALGVESDRRLDVPGEEHPNVYSAGRITRLFNGHPDELRDGRDLGGRTLIIGNGNVSIDIVRLLSKASEDLSGSDIDDDFHRTFVGGLHEINVVGRGTVHDARFDRAMVKELGRIGGVAFRVHDVKEASQDLDTVSQGKVDELLLLESIDSSESPRVIVNFHFGWVPESITESAGHLQVRFNPRYGEGSPLTLSTDTVITAVGFAPGGRDHFVREELVVHGAGIVGGELGPGLYCTGWFGQGAQGTIPEQRTAAKALAGAIAAELSRAAKSTKPGLAGLPTSLIERAVSFDDWKLIDEVERTTAPEGRFRRKLITREELLSVAKRSATALAEGTSA